MTTEADEVFPLEVMLAMLKLWQGEFPNSRFWAVRDDGVFLKDYSLFCPGLRVVISPPEQSSAYYITIQAPAGATESEMISLALKTWLEKYGKAKKQEEVQQ